MSAQAPIWVFGASGYVGSALLEALTRQGYATVAHLRPDSTKREAFAAHLASLGAHAKLDATPFDVAALAACWRREPPRAILITIGTTRARAKQLKRRCQSEELASYEAVDFGLTAVIAQAARASKATTRLVYLSALGADARSGNAYLKARGKAEEAIRQSKLPFAILRPALITGSDRRELRLGERLGGSVLDGALSLGAALGLGKLRRDYASIDAAQAAAALLRLAVSPAPLNDVITIGAAREQGLCD